jgi:hypothetical protein
MADLNALIAQGYQFQAPPDPFAQYGKMQQLQQGEQTNQLNQMKMQEYQRGIQEQNALRGLDPSSPTYLNEVTKINPKLGFEFAKSQQEAKTARTEGQIKDTKLLTDKLALLPDMYARADTPDKYIALHESIHADPILGNYLKNIGATKEQGRAKINEAITNGTFDTLRAGSMQSVAQVLAQIEDTAYAQSKNAPAPGAMPVSAPNYGANPLVPMPNEPMVAPAVRGLNADQARAELAVAPNALAPQVVPVNALAAAPTVDRVKQIDDRLLEGNTAKYKNSTGWKDEKKILETERADLVKVQPDIALMKALNIPNTQAGYVTLQALKNSSPTEFERAIKAANLNPAETVAANRAYLTHKTTHAPGTVVNIDQKQEGAFATGLGAGQAKAVLESKTGAQDAAEILRTNQVGRDLLKSGAITGTGADFFVGFNNALKQAGIDFGYADAAANSQAYAAAMGANVGRIVKQFGAGTGLSDADREYAAQIAGGKIALTDTALRRILDINDRAANRVIDLHNKNVSGIKTNIPLTVEKPAFTPPSPSGASLIPGSTPAAAGGGATVTLPDGRIKTFPNAAAANQFKKAAGL